MEEKNTTVLTPTEYPEISEIISDIGNNEPTQEEVPESAPTDDVEQQQEETVIESEEPIVSETPKLSDFDQIIEKPELEENIEEKQETKPLTQQTQAKKERDYSVFTDEEKKIFKGVSNEAFEYLKKVLPELRQKVTEYEKKLSEQGEKSTLPHPDSYVLSEEFRNSAIQSQIYDFEEKHWEQQLEKLRSGSDKLVDLLGIDEKGNPKYAEVPVTPENTSKLEIQLLKNIQAASAAKREALNTMNRIKESYVKEYENAVKTIRELENRYLSAYDLSKSHRSKEMNAFLEKLPKQFKNDPLAPTVAKMFGMILDLIETNKKSEKKKSVKNPQPTEADIKPSGSTPLTVYDPKEYLDEII